jgi:predicted dehydrogenase
MNDAARQANRHLIVNFETRFYDHFRKIREWIQAGRLGRIEAIHIQHFWDGHKAYGPSSERRARLMNLAGGLDCGIHKLDVVRFFCGGKWQEVTARGVWLGENLKKPPHIGILATLDNGVMATVNVSMGYAAQIPPRPMCEVLTIVGNRGVVSMMEDIPNVEKRVQLETVVRLFSETGQEDCRVIEPPHHIAITRLLDDLADVVDGGKSPSGEMPTGEDGLMAQIAVEQANADAIKHRVTLDK